jgi:hypothetical protein
VESISVQDVQDAKGTHLQTTGNLLNNQYQDIAGDPVTNLANFQIDTAPPVLGATPIAIQQTNGKTSLATPVITLEATDNYNLTKAVFSLNGGTSWCAPIDYAGTINTFDITSSACGGRSTNETKTVTVKFRDAAGNESANAQAQVDYDNSKPQIQTFTTDTATGVYGPGTAIKITATYNENITAGNLVVNLNNGKQVTLDTVENGNQLTTGAKPYVIGSTGSGEDTSKLRVAAIVSQSVSDTADPVNTQEGTSLAGISANLDAGNKTIEIDTIAPVGTVVVDRSKDSNQIQINATDAHDSGMLVQIVPLDDPVAVDSYTKPCNDAVFTSLNDAWSIYADNINTNLIEKSTPDKARKVCARFKDQMGNISSIVEAVTPETPDGVQIDDISNSQISFYGSMLTWQVPALKGTGGTDPFSQYEILKCGPSDSSDCITAYDSTKAERTITDIAKNYYVDTGLISDKYYCYQVRFKDKNGDYSKLPNNTCLQAGHAPAVTDSKVSIVSGHADDVLITDVTESSATVIFQTRDAKYDRPSPSKATITAYTSPTLQEADRAPSTPTPLEADFSVVHTIKLTGLQGGTDYYLKINAIDSWNNPGELLYSPNAIPGLTFKTLGVLTKITDISDPPSVLTDTRAVISFKTDQNAKCLIQYGTSSIANSDAITAYKEVPIGEDDKAEYTNNHSLTLSGLPDTTYYYQITCYDNGKTHTVFSKEYSFKTALKGLTQGDVNAQIGANKTPPVISSVSLANVTGESATITWNTDKSSNSSVIYNPTGATFSRIEGDQLVNTDVTKYVTGHTVTIPGLIPDSKYDFSVMSADASGNITESGISTFTTKAPSSLSSIKVISTALGQATITWSTSSATSSVVEYGLTTTYGQTKQDTSKIKDHTIILDGLTPGQEYHFRVKGEDDLKNIFASSDITFQPKAPPKISDFKIDSIFEHGATVTFVTNVPTDATVTFTDTTKAENSGVQGNPTISTKHEIKLKDLVSGEDFAIKVKVRDEDGNEAEENFQKFTTTKDEVPPKIDRVKTDTALTQNDKVQAIISWTTDEMATGKILYKEGKTGDVKTFDVNTSPSFSHVGVVTSFKPGVVYYFNVVSADVAGNVATSNDFALLTPKQKQNIIQVIIGNFQSIFNWTGNVGK